jgi:hypothetical protein
LFYHYNNIFPIEKGINIMVRNCKKKERDFRGISIFELKKD